MSSEQSLLTVGGKTGVLLLPDPCTGRADAKLLTQQLARRGLTVAVPQLAGTKPGRQVTASALIASAQAGLTSLKERCSDITVVGSAYGAMLALEVARESGSEIQAVALLEPRAWLPGLSKVVGDRLAPHIRQAWLGQVATRAKDMAPRLAAATRLPFIARIAPSGSIGGVPDHLVLGVGQLLDCLHATLAEIKQPVLVLRRQDCQSVVTDTAILLQRRLRGRVETGVIPSLEADVVADRLAGFLAAIMDEVTTRRDNEQRRRRIQAGRSNAA